MLKLILGAAIVGAIFGGSVQILKELGVPVPFVAVTCMGFIGSILTHATIGGTSIAELICAFGAGGFVPTPLGLGQAGYMAGAGIMTGNYGPLIEGLFLNGILLLMGCIAGVVMYARNNKKDK